VDDVLLNLHSASEILTLLDQHCLYSATDLQGRIVAVNDNFCRTSGYSRAELLGQTHRIISSGENDPAVFADMWNTITQGGVWRGDIKNRKKNGDFFWTKTSISPVLDDNGAARSYVSLRTDITSNKLLEQQLMLARQAADEAALAKSQFLATMSHEIRTPMNAVLGMLKLLKGTGLNAAQLDYLGKTEYAAKSLLGLLEGILDFSRVEAGKLVLDAEPFRLCEMLRELEVILLANMGQKAVQLRFELDPNLPVLLIGDALRLKQVLINLGSNALKFTSTGEVVVAVAVTATLADAATLKFSVSDTGIGIPADQQERIFDTFTQAEASTTRRFGGTGLGLAISQRLVALMGGELQVQSTPGVGSCFAFSVTLPVETTVPSQPPVVGDICKLASSREPQPLGLAGMRILVVEDNLLNQQVAQGLLSREGALVSLADNGQQGVAAVAAANPAFDVVLMDLQMPVLDGLDATRIIRQELGFTALPIIAVSANVMAEDIAESLAAGMTDHVGKPFELSKLVAVLRRHAGWEDLAAPTQVSDRALTQVPGSAPLVVGPPAQIDIAQALEWMGGDTALYRTFALGFVNDIASNADQLARHLARAEQRDAARLMHTLKGLARTVGAHQLADFAAGYESELKRLPLDPQKFESMVKQTRDRIAAVSAEIQRFVEKINVDAA